MSNAGIFSNASNVLLTGGATSYFSNSGILSNTGAAAFFQNTSNTGTLGVAGITTHASNVLQTAAGAYLSNAGPFSNAGVTTIASNVLLTGGATAYLSNSGLFSNTGIATFGSNIYTQSPTNATIRHIFGSNASLTNLDFCSLIQSCNNSANYGSELSFWTHGTGTNGADPTRAMTIAATQYVGINCNSPAYVLDVNGAAQISGNLNVTGTLTGGGFSAANWYQYSAISNVNMSGNTLTYAFLSNVSSSLTTTKPIVYAKTDTGFGQADPNSFNLWHGVYVKHTGSANDQLLSLYATGSSSGWTITCRDDYYAVGIPLTFTTGNFAVNAAGNLDLLANYTTIKGSSNFNILAYFVGITGSNGITLAGNTSNTGTLGVGGLATFGNSSNTGTLGVAGVTTHASNVLQTAAASYMSNAGIFSNASNVYLTGGTSSYLSNSGILSNTAAAAYFQNTSNTGTLGVAGITTFSSNIVQGLGNVYSRTFGLYNASVPYNSDLFITANLASITADGTTITGATYDSASYGSAAIRLLTTQNGGIVAGITIAASASVNTAPVNVATISASQPFKLDVNGTSRGAIYYSTMTTGGTLTITTNNNYGVYYNITATGTYTIQVEATQQTSNIGKYYTFRNNTGASLSITLTNATGITSPITINSNASATIVVAAVTSYALF